MEIPNIYTKKFTLDENKHDLPINKNIFYAVSSFFSRVDCELQGFQILRKVICKNSVSEKFILKCFKYFSMKSRKTRIDSIKYHVFLFWTFFDKDKQIRIKKFLVHFSSYPSSILYLSLSLSLFLALSIYLSISYSLNLCIISLPFHILIFLLLYFLCYLP